MRHASRPRGLVLDEVPAPRRLAPYAAALSAETVETHSDAPIASGRFVVLHDPAGQEAWDGDFRLVVMARSRLDEEVGTDPLLGSAAWSWLTDALDGAGAGYRALVGTVTRVLSETFGGLELNDACAHAEIRALRAAGAALGDSHLDGCTLVVTLEPCTMCAGAIVLARVARLVLGAWEPRTGACGSVRDVVRDTRSNHQVEVRAGLRAQQSQDLLTAFFADRR